MKASRWGQNFPFQVGDEKGQLVDEGTGRWAVDPDRRDREGEPIAGEGGAGSGGAPLRQVARGNLGSQYERDNLRQAERNVWLRK